jgi:hypothetical protein
MCCGGAGERLLFFEPTQDRGARDAKGARQAAQAGTLLVGAQNQVALRFGIAVRTRLGGGAPPALAAAETLATVGGGSVANDVRALAMRAGNRKSDHKKRTKTNLSNHRGVDHYRFLKPPTRKQQRREAKRKPPQRRDPCDPMLCRPDSWNGPGAESSAPLLPLPFPPQLQHRPTHLLWNAPWRLDRGKLEQKESGRQAWSGLLPSPRPVR